MPENSPPASPAVEYERRAEARQAAVGTCEDRYNRYGNYRAVVVVAGLVLLYVILRGQAMSPWWLMAPLLGYVWLGFRLDRTRRDIDQATRAVHYYQQSIARLDNSWAGNGTSGDRFLRDDHLYGADLDIFGTGSLFELICAARTRMGEDTLADWLSGPSDADTVQSRQGAIEELAPKLDLREDLALLGESSGSGVHPDQLAAWGDRSPVLQPTAFRWIAIGISVLGGLAAVGILAYLFGLAEFVAVPEQTMSFLRIYIVAASILIALVIAKFRKQTHQVIAEVKEAAKDLRLLSDVLARVESEEFTSPFLREMRAALDVAGEPPSQRVHRLRKLVDIFDARNNQMFALIAPFLLWDLHCSYAVEAWRAQSGPTLRVWLRAIGEIEAISSFSGFRFDRPSYIYPEIVDADHPFVEGDEMAHPLLAADGAIANDVRIGEAPSVIIVSGSNMSGKSTFLRTVGVNAVLAQAGAPVRAKRLRLTPLTITASIRVTDSLREGASRFYAEITRLRGIVDASGGTPPALFLLDEFLHGTNSHDRRIGAEAIVKGLVDKGSIGFVTTHDLALAGIADSVGPRGKNVHFEDHFEQGEMTFDYKMRDGVVEKSNALPLMRSIGLDV